MRLLNSQINYKLKMKRGRPKGSKNNKKDGEDQVSDN